MKDVREWIQLIFVVVGGILALIAYFQNLKQRRVENALKFIALFRDGLREGDLGHWEALFRKTTELAGAKQGKYINDDGTASSLADYFREGAPDAYAIARLARALDVVCHQVVSKIADAKTVYYELGQLLDTMQDWLSGVKGIESGSSLLDTHPSLKSFFEQYEPMRNQWPSRVYAYIE